MKKITGKALSLVLSIALVASSFSASFASASTKTADGIVSDTDKDTIYLVNGGTSSDALKSPELIANWIQPTLQTNTRDEVDTIKVDAISHVSGDSLVSLTTSNSNEEAWLKLKSKSVKGTEVISILYEGSYTDDNGTDYTIKARKNFTVTVYDKGTPVLGEVKDSTNPTILPDSGKGLDDFETFAQTRNTVKTVGLYVAEPASAYDPSITDARVHFAPISVTTNKNGVTPAVVSAYGSTVVKDSAYYLEITDGKSDLHFTNSHMIAQASSSVGTAQDGQLTTLNDSPADAFKLVSGNGTPDANGLYNKDAGTTNITFTLKKLTSTGKVSTSSDDKYTFKTKIEKKVNVAQAFANFNYDNVNVKHNAPETQPNSWTVKKEDGQTRLYGVIDYQSSDGKASTPKDLNVSDAILDFPNGTVSTSIGDDSDSTNTKGIVGYVGNMTIGEDAHVGNINTKDGTVDVNGKVGDITTDDKNWVTGDTSNHGAVTIEGSATAGDIDTTSADNDKTDEGAVVINGGTVGNVTTKNTVTIDGQDSDDNITTGVVTAVGGKIYSDEAKISLGGLKAKDDNGTFTFEGDSVTVKSIDLDSRTTTVAFGSTDDDETFTGTVPAIQNATNATIKTEDEDSKVTISGDVNADEISLDSDTDMILAGNSQVKTIDGDGTLTIPAGKLYVTDSVSSTKLKLSDANIAVGTVVFKAKSDCVNADDFDPYGFTLSTTTGNTVDTFKIASLKFAGMQISGGPSQIVVGQSATYNCSAYPTGTSVPAGYTVEWTMDGGSTDVFTLTSSGNTATLKVNSLDANFASENKTTLTATMYDADGYQSDDYDAATFDVTAVATPSFTSDTPAALTVAQGANYTFKITTSDGKEPTFSLGGTGFSLTKMGKSGNSYFYKVVATGAVKTSVGVYVNGVRSTVLTIGASTLKVDTTKVTIKTGASYTFKVSGTSVKPTFTSGNSAVAKVASSSESAGSYFFKVSAVKAGSTGIYVNGVRAAVVTVA